MEHPTELELSQYRKRQLQPAAMLAVDDHLAQCQPCRRFLRDCEPLVNPAGLLAQLGEKHLDHSAIEAYVEGLAGHAERAAVDSHLAVCPSCRAEIEDLQAFHRSLPPAVRPRPLRLWLPLAAGILVAAAAFWVWSTPHRAPGLVASTLAAGKLEIPASVLALRGPQPIVRGSQTAAGFALLRPLATAVVSDRPHLVWQSLPNANAYRVAVFAPGFRKIAESDWLPQSAHLGGPDRSVEWTPAAPLDRGLTYSWQVIARMGSSEDAPTVRAPSLNSPEALFLVLGATQAAELAKAAHDHPGEHLLLGVLYARAGVLDLAEQEFAAAPPSPDSATLLERLHAARR